MVTGHCAAQRYIQAPLSYPAERKRDQGGPPGWSPFLVWSRDKSAKDDRGDGGRSAVANSGSDAAAPPGAADIDVGGANGGDSSGGAGSGAGGGGGDGEVSGGGSGRGARGGSGGGGGGRFVPYPQKSKWSDHYRTTPRDPSNLELAPWAAKVWGEPT